MPNVVHKVEYKTNREEKEKEDDGAGGNAPIQGFELPDGHLLFLTALSFMIAS